MSYLYWFVVVYVIAIWAIMFRACGQVPGSWWGKLWVGFWAPLNYPIYLISTNFKALLTRNTIVKLNAKWALVEKESILEAETPESLRSLLGSTAIKGKNIKYTGEAFHLLRPFEVNCIGCTIDLQKVKVSVDSFPVIKILGAENRISNLLVKPLWDLDLETVLPYTDLGVNENLSLVVANHTTNSLLLDIEVSIKE